MLFNDCDRSEKIQLYNFCRHTVLRDSVLPWACAKMSKSNLLDQLVQEMTGVSEIETLESDSRGLTGVW